MMSTTERTPAMFSTRDAKEDDLEKALRLSAKEARLAAMSDEELVQAAIKESLEAEEGKTRVKEEGSSSSSHKRKLGGSSDRAGSLKALKVTSEAPEDGTVEPTLGNESFDDGKEHLVNRLNGSLDLIVCKEWIKKSERLALRRWMLSQLAWHRVTYVRPRTNIRIVTPRYTSTFGKDDTNAPPSAYKVQPKPFPDVLEMLRQTLERKTGARFNAIIINYYADGSDAISYHSDDEAFLGKDPTIASISLGASRDFYLRRKAPASQDVPEPTAAQKMGTKGQGPAAARPTEKMVLDDGDLLIMRGRTQAEWEHSIPKRARHVGGRINMTFRRVMNVSGTNSELTGDHA
jgi:alkylated DNA repair dioxygenase AlkB